MELPWAWTVLPPNIEWAITWAAEDIWYTSLTWYHLKNSVQNRSIRPFIISLSGSTSLISWCSSHKIILFLHWCLPPELTVKRMLNQFSWESFLLPNLSSQSKLPWVKSASPRHIKHAKMRVWKNSCLPLWYFNYFKAMCAFSKNVTHYIIHSDEFIGRRLRPLPLPLPVQGSGSGQCMPR